MDGSLSFTNQAIDIAGAISSVRQNEINNAQVIPDPGTTVNIHGGSFLHVEGDSTQTHYYQISLPISDERGLHTLLQGIARDAMYDSAERFPPPKCHPDTRVKILKEIEDWTNDPTASYPVFWLHAPAGEGKSAIMQTIAQLLSPPNGNVVATFFFGRGKGKREQAQYLFSTLAHQLALNIPGLRVHIDEIVRLKPTLPSSSMDFQVQSLLVDAFAMLQDHPRVPLTIIIDGLDECNDENDQQSILGLIGQLLTVDCLPLRFLIASRPEPQIREVFDGPILQKVTFRTTITNDFTSRKDIEKYLRDRFADIYRRKSRLIGKSEGPIWPSEGVIQFLVSKASGQFIYATTVLKFVDDKFSRPGKQLDIILSPGSSQKSAFSDLDTLYSHILSTYPDFESLTQVLGFIVVMSEPSGIVLEDLLQFESGEVELILQGLHSLMNGIQSRTTLAEPVSGFHESHTQLDSFNFSDSMDEFDNDGPVRANGSTIQISHASFQDFLVDQHRAGRYYIDTIKFNTQVVTAAFSLMSNIILDTLKGGIGRPIHQETVVSMGKSLFLNLAGLRSVPPEVLDSIAEIEEEFRQKDPRTEFIVPIQAFFAVDLLITNAMHEVKERALFSRPENRTDVAEYWLAISRLNHRYLRLLYQCYDQIFSQEGHPLSGVPEILIVKEAFSAEALADLFMLNSYTIHKFWHAERIDLKKYRLGHPRFLKKSLDFLGTIDFASDESRLLCNKIQHRHLDLCRRILSRFFGKNWADTCEPHQEICNYIDQHFVSHLNGLTLGPFNDNCFTTILDILDDLEVPYSSYNESSSTHKLVCI